MNDAFSTLLLELGNILNMSLEPDKVYACSLSFANDLIVQLQTDQSQEFLWIFCKISPLSPGRFREEVLKHCLKYNGKKGPNVGVFGFIEASNFLTFFQKYPLKILSGQNLAGILGAFLQSASKAKKNIESNEYATLDNIE